MGEEAGCVVSVPVAQRAMMAKKIQKASEPEPFELEVAQAICDLEANSNDLKAELRELYIVGAKEVDVTGKRAVVIFVPFKLLKVVRKIQSRLVREVRATPAQPVRPCHRPLIVTLACCSCRRCVLCNAVNPRGDNAAREEVQRQACGDHRQPAYYAEALCGPAATEAETPSQPNAD